jgi:hypothetical protein
VAKYVTKYVAAEDDTLEGGTTAAAGGGGAQFWHFGPLITTLWFLQDQVRVSSVT